MRRLEVFGRELLAERTATGWRLFHAGDEGKRGPEITPAIPAFVQTDAELLGYLADLFHESATPARPGVRWVG